MPDTLEQLQAHDTAVQNARLQQAVHAASWSSTFDGPQSDAALRASRDVTELRNNALDMKARLLAQTDKNAQEIYQKGAQFKEWQDQAPLRDQLLRARIESEGAATRFQQQKEAQTHEAVAGFYNHMLNGPTVTDPNYDAHVISGIAKFPAFATTAEGRDLLKTLGQEHDLAKQLQTISSQLPEFQINTVEASPDKIIHTTSSPINGGGIGRKATTNPAYLKQTAAVAAAQAEKDAAYNKNPKIDLTPHDTKLATETAKLGAIKEALGITDAPAVPVDVSSDNQALQWAKSNPNDPRAGKILALHSK